MRQHATLRDALTEAYAGAPRVIGWLPGGWLTYPATIPPAGVTPEMFIAGLGAAPVALSATGAEAWVSLLRSTLLQANTAGRD